MLTTYKYKLKKKIKTAILSSIIDDYRMRDLKKELATLVFIRFIRSQPKYGSLKKTKKKKQGALFSIVKMYTYLYFHLIKYNKNYKFSKGVGRLVYRPNFNTIKHRYLVAKFRSLKKNKIVKKIKKTVPKNLKLLLFFLVNYVGIASRFKVTTKTRLNKVSVFSNILYALLQVLTNMAI